jgi:hypothetical protein
MPSFRIHRMKPHVRQNFRWAPHTSGVSQLKPRDYEPAGELEADSYYDLWTRLRGSEDALDVGDVLEIPGGEVRICKYVGFEEARWILPEQVPVLEPATTAAP